MPFKSKRQQRFMFAAEGRGELPPGTAERWAHHTPDIKGLPERACQKKDHGQCKHASTASNFLAGLLGTADFGAEAIARKAGTGIRRSIVPAAGGAAVVKAVEKSEPGVEKTAFWQGFVKSAQTITIDPGMVGAAGGLSSGYSSGRSAAGTTANALSRKGYKTKNEETARNVAKLTGTLGALGGLALGYRHGNKAISLLKKHVSPHPHMEALYHGLVPFAAGTAGGALAGAGTGAATSLRGALIGHKKEAFWNAFTKKADGGMGDGGPTGMTGVGKGQLGSSTELTVASGTAGSSDKTDKTILDRDRNPRDFSPNDLFGPVLEEENGSHLLY